MTLVSDQHGFVFVHVPKTGGTSVKEALARYHDHDGLVRGSATKHLTVAQLRAGWPTVRLDELLTFAFVRDPFAYLVSFWCFKMQHPEHPDHEQVAACGSFAGFVASIDGRASMTQSMYTHDDAGNQVVDVIGRYERLHQDFAAIVARIGLPPTRLARCNRSIHGPVASYYTDALADRVLDAFAVDFDRLGYPKRRPGSR